MRPIEKTVQKRRKRIFCIIIYKKRERKIRRAWVGGKRKCRAAAACMRSASCFAPSANGSNGAGLPGASCFCLYIKRLAFQKHDSYSCF